jgi:TolB-like protein
VFQRSLAAGVAGLLLCLPTLAEAAARIALLPISVYAAGVDTDYLSTGLAEMLAARLERYDGVAVVRPAADVAAPDGEAEALEAAGALGADFVLFGSFTQFGEGASLDLRCARVAEASERGEDGSRRVFIHSGTVAEIIPKLDTLAEKVVRYAFGGAGGARRVAEPEAGEGGGSGAAADAALADLQSRVDALERAVYAPTVSGEPAPAAGAEAENSGSPVR